MISGAPVTKLITKEFKDLSGQESYAVFSEDMKFRYLLQRTWDWDKPTIAFVMLNPSTADEVKNDPTVSRCQVRAHQMGYGTLRVVNIFAFRSTNPKNLYEVDDPIGPDNDLMILKGIVSAKMIVCAWGRDGKLKGRGKEVLRNIAAYGREIHVLRVNDDGQPGHPLYQSYDCVPYLFTNPETKSLPASNQKV